MGPSDCRLSGASLLLSRLKDKENSEPALTESSSVEVPIGRTGLN